MAPSSSVSTWSFLAPPLSIASTIFASAWPSVLPNSVCRRCTLFGWRRRGSLPANSLPNLLIQVQRSYGAQVLIPGVAHTATERDIPDVVKAPAIGAVEVDQRVIA